MLGGRTLTHSQVFYLSYRYPEVVSKPSSECYRYFQLIQQSRMQCEMVEGGLKGNQLILATMKKMWRTGGIPNFYRGLPLGLVGVFPYR